MEDKPLTEVTGVQRIDTHATQNKSASDLLFRFFAFLLIQRSDDNLFLLSSLRDDGEMNSVLKIENPDRDAEHPANVN